MGVEFNYKEIEKEIVHPFPSVDSGVIDTTRAKKELDWKPTTLVLVSQLRRSRWEG